MAMLLLANTVLSSPRESALGLAFLAAGIPAHFALRWRKARAAPAP